MASFGVGQELRNQERPKSQLPIFAAICVSWGIGVVLGCLRVGTWGSVGGKGLGTLWGGELGAWCKKRTEPPKGATSVWGQGKGSS